MPVQDADDSGELVLPTHDSGRQLTTSTEIVDVLDTEDVERGLQRRDEPRDVRPARHP